MAYILIEDFKAGIDRRRPMSAAHQGTLYELINAHITPGGDIEKRKAFAPFAELPAGTHGLHAAPSGLMVFGSGEEPADMPPKVRYRQLPPTSPSTALTRLLDAENFGDGEYAIGQFSNGTVAHYYKGARVEAWDSIASDASSAEEAATILASRINSVGVFSAVAQGASVLVTGHTPAQDFAWSVAVDGEVDQERIEQELMRKPTDGLFVAVSNFNSAIITSPDGVSWAERQALAGSWVDVAWSPELGLFVAIKDHAIATSPDGINWTERTAPYGTWRSITWSPGLGLFVAVAATFDAITTSPDGINWIKRDSPEGEWYSVTWSSEKELLVAVGNNAVMTSPDGAKWTKASPPAGTWRSVVWSPENGLFVAVANSNNATMISPDGVNWTKRSAPEGTWISVDWSPDLGLFVAVSNNHNVAMTSPDGINWTSRSVPEGTWWSVTWSPEMELFVAVGYNAVMTSSDGINWVERQAVGGNWVEVAWAPPQPTVHWVRRFTLAGGFSPNVNYHLTLEGQTYSVLSGQSGAGQVALTHNGKVYSAARSLLFFSGFDKTTSQPDPTRWHETPDTIGAGFIDMTIQSGGVESLIALGIYQDLLAVFSARSTYLWRMNADPLLNQSVQALVNIGIIAPGSVVPYGDHDLFFLSNTGVRSLRARDSSNTASSVDIGTPIDKVIREHLVTLPEGAAERATAAIEPESGRYWLALGDRIYVFSHYPLYRIAAWSVYQAPAPIDALAAFEGRMYLRCGDVVYLYGGQSNEEYDASVVIVQLPFLDNEKPATSKRVTGFDVDCDGVWDAEMLVNPKDLSHVVPVANGIAEMTYNSGNIGVSFEATHFAPRLTCESNAYARLSSIAVHIEKTKEE